MHCVKTRLIVNTINIKTKNTEVTIIMVNFLISAAANLVITLIAFFIFKAIISGPTRHRIYEKVMDSFAKFVIYIFIASVVITSLTALVLYKTRYIAYVNIAAPALVSIIVGFVASTVPTRGAGDEEKEPLKDKSGES